MTYPALVALQKQSVEDAERMFSSTLLKLMEDLVKLTTSMLCLDGGGLAMIGLSERTRCCLNYNILTLDFSVFFFLILPDIYLGGYS